MSLEAQLLTNSRCGTSDFVDGLLQIFPRNPKGVSPVLNFKRFVHIDFRPVRLNAVLSAINSSHENERALLLRSQVYRAFYCARLGQSGFLSKSAFIEICASYCLAFSSSAFLRLPFGKSWA
jgi:hypothetical protein